MASLRLLLAVAFAAPWSALAGHSWTDDQSDFERGVGIADIVNAKGETYHREFFSCKKGSVITRLTTFFRSGSDFPKRIWAFGCRPLGNYKSEELTENCHISEDLEQPDGRYALCTKPHSFINGVGRLSKDGGATYIYQMRCCQVLKLTGDSREFIQLAFETCKDYPLVNMEENADIVFGEAEVAVGLVSSLHNNDTWDRSWRRRMCDFRDAKSTSAFPTKCRMTMVPLAGSEADNDTLSTVENKMFRSMRMSLDDCLKQCRALPFCTTIRYNGDGLCRFTYARPTTAEKTACKSMTNVEKFPLDADVWIPCWDCPQRLTR